MSNHSIDLKDGNGMEVNRSGPNTRPLDKIKEGEDNSTLPKGAIPSISSKSKRIIKNKKPRQGLGTPNIRPNLLTGL